VPDPTDLPETEWPVTRISKWWRLDPFAIRTKGDSPTGGELVLTMSESEAIEARVAQLRQEPRYMQPPEDRRPTPGPREFDGLGVRIVNTEPARASDGRPAEALPPSRTQYLPPSYGLP